MTIPIIVFVLLVIFATIGLIVLAVWIFGLIVYIKSLIEIKKNETNDNQCPYYVESNDE